MTFAYYAVAAGAWIHEHSHPNDEVWNVIDGELEIKIAAETQVAGPGCAVVVPPDTAHSVKALTDVRAIVVDYPKRYSIGGTELLDYGCRSGPLAPMSSAVVTAFTDPVRSF